MSATSTVASQPCGPRRYLHFDGTFNVAATGASPTGNVETVTGRPPASFEAFAWRNAASWSTPEVE
jgi:hypothetical protein